MTNGAELVTRVANLLIDAGWNVQLESVENGIQSDIKATRPDERPLVVECKSYRKLVGLRSAREFASVVGFLRESDPELRGWLVTTSGFTKNATDELERGHLKGLTDSELAHRLAPDTNAPSKTPRRQVADVITARRSHKRVFVIMPLREEMFDVFFFGVRWAADQVGAVAVRSDHLEHNAEIISAIKSAIQDYDVIVGDTTGGNPNVCYEIGYAHALGKPTILICKKGEILPFDLQGTNHIMYPNVLGLRAPLKAKLKAALGKKT